VQCQVSGRDRFGRALANCESGGALLNAGMVESGHALAFGAFEAEQARAKAEKRGLWATTFDPPREWRAKHDRAGK
jgi:endonuclease YncB( thermonuclease family)